MKLKLLAVFLSAFLVSVPALAEHEGTAHEKSHRVKVDADGDGKVSYDEYRASKEKRTERQFKRMDTNNDGYIDESEKSAQKDKMREMRKKRKQRRDSAESGQ